jgi:hypothetical protein
MRISETFVAKGELTGWMRWITPIAQRVIARQFAEYHRNLCRNLERPRSDEAVAQQ